MPSKQKTAETPIAPDFITTKQVVEELKVHPATIKRAIRDGRLKAYQIGNGYRTTREWLNEYLQKMIVTAEG